MRASRKMLKGPGLKLSVLHFSVIKCKFQSYDDNIGPKLRKPNFVTIKEIYWDLL